VFFSTIKLLEKIIIHITVAAAAAAAALKSQSIMHYNKTETFGAKFCQLSPKNVLFGGPG
jgi:hypothetical protein